jgi:eukaryotic-like serine/threonine-protein kinase
MTTVFKQVGPYQIIRQIGHGGMAVVFLATDTRADRQVALKLVQRGSDRETREIVEAEQFGAELQKRFGEHGAHVPIVYEYGIDEDSGYFYVAMEYLDGENLSEVVAQGPLEPERAAGIAGELARFLEDAHAFEAVVNGRNLQSLLHLDLKPRNVRITSAKQVKVLDFGTAKGLSLSRKVTRNDFGSVAYLSPERLETGEVDARADLWALGVVIYEMLRGAPPFQAEDTRRLERLILSRRPPPTLAGDCPAGLAAIVAKMLDPRQSERYATAGEIRADIDRFQAGLRTLAEDQGWPDCAFDGEATRKTSSDVTARTHGGDEERTRRTVPPPLPPIAVAVGKPPAPPAAPVASAKAAPAPRPAKEVTPPKPPSRTRRIFRAALLLIALGLAANEIQIGNEAGELAHSVATYEFDRLPSGWGQYDDLRSRSQLHFGTGVLEGALRDRTLVLVERVIANYRTPNPTVREAQWTAARAALERALSFGGDDRRLRADLRYCEGHLHRINGEAQKTRGDGDEGQEELNNAVVAFREASELRPEWQDPLLGLARTFIVGLDDVELGADALNKARELGYTQSDRESLLLADGYRSRGNSLVRTARQLKGLPQEHDYLTRAAEAYRLALSFYASAPNTGVVPQNVARTQRALVEVEQSLGEGFTALPEGEQP